MHNGTLSHLIVCFSRDEPDAAGTINRPTYVQHNLRLHAKNVASILLKDKACLYVCGWVQNLDGLTLFTMCTVIFCSSGMRQYLTILQGCKEHGKGCE